MRSQRANAFNDGDQAGKHLLKVLFFNGARVETKVLSNQCPHWFEILLRRHFKPFVFDVHLADGFKNVACGGDCLPWVCLDIRERAIELLVN